MGVGWDSEPSSCLYALSLSLSNLVSPLINTQTVLILISKKVLLVFCMPAQILLCLVTLWLGLFPLFSWYLGHLCPLSTASSHSPCPFPVVP